MEGRGWRCPSNKLQVAQKAGLSGATKSCPWWADGLEAPSGMDHARCCFTVLKQRRFAPHWSDVQELSSLCPTKPVPREPGELPPKLEGGLDAHSMRGATTLQTWCAYTVAEHPTPVISTPLIELQG